MHTPRQPNLRLTRSVALVLAIAIIPVLAGCASAGLPPAATASASPGASQPPTSAGPATPAASGAASSDPNGSIGSDLPIGAGPVPVDPAGRIVTPRPGQLDVHPIPATRFSSVVEGRRVVIAVHFSSGIEPCSVLDSIVVARNAGSFVITLREGRGPGDVVCDMIAESKRAIVDLGDLPSGSYTISAATGGAAPISVIVS